MNQTIKELMERKSVRVYEERVIEPEKKAAILEAALQAPTAGNMTLYSIIDVTDQKRKETLSITCDNQPFIAKAPLVLVFVADYHRWYELFCHYEDVVRKPGLGDLMLACDDALIAAQNAVVAAESLGIGSCYIGDIMEQYETHREAERKKPERLRPEAVVFENSYRRLDPEEFTRELKRIQGREEDFEHWVKAFCKRKWNSDFSTEMSRSMEAMIESWKKEE